MLAITTVLTFVQDIADVSQSSNVHLVVRNAKNKTLSSKYLFNGDQLAGFSSTIIIIKSESGKVSVYDQELHKLASKFMDKEDVVKHVNGSNIIIKTGLSGDSLYP